MPHPRLFRILPLLLLGAACADDPTTTTREPGPDPGPRVVGVYRFTVTGIGTTEMRTTVSPVPLATGAGGASATLTPVAAGLTFEQISSSRMTHGERGQGGQRYFTYTTRMRNGTGAALTNLTFIPVTDSTKYAGTPFTVITLQSGAPANPAIAPKIVPTGFVTIGDDGGLRAPLPDVLQVFEESEIAAITLPAPYTYAFPYGFVTRNPSTPSSRTLPATTDPNDFTGTVTFAFRFPLQANAADDPASVTFDALAVEDTETRLTESIEEGHDSVAVRALRDRAAALGATTVTVLAGSTALDPAVDDYPGQRQVCSVRTAGPPGGGTTLITEPAAYAELLVLRPGEFSTPCAPYFRGGTPGRPGWGLSFALTMKAMDLYGNHKTLAVDTVRLQLASGIAPSSLGAATAMSGGQATIGVTYLTYGESVLRAVGRRTRALQPLTVAGTTRVWTGAVSTNPGDPANWDVGQYPSAQDTAYFPAGKPFYPVMGGNAPIGSLILEDGATFDLGPWTVTVAQSAWAGTVGGITSTTGQLLLTGTGTGPSIKGNLPRMRITGTYVLAGPVTARARIETDGGRLRTIGHRLQTISY